MKQLITYQKQKRQRNTGRDLALLLILCKKSWKPCERQINITKGMKFPQTSVPAQK